MSRHVSAAERSVAVVTNIPRPYRQALFHTVREHLADRGLQLRVFYTSDPAKHVRRGSSVEIDPRFESYVPGLTLRTSYERVISFPRGLSRQLAECAPACVIAGGFGMDALVAARWCARARVPRVIWSGAWPGREGKVGALSLQTRRYLVRHSQAFAAYGTAAADYLVDLGAPADHVFHAWNTVDLESAAAVAREAAERRPELSSKWGLAERNLVYVGTLVESKGLRELVAAAWAARPRSSDWVLHLLGSGPLGEELRQTVATAGAGQNFRFHGLRPQNDVWELLGLVDGFVLPTKHEAWGLVINEAMACGVPVVVSPQAGATRDLVEHGVTGFVVDPADTVGLGAILARLVDDPSCKEIGRAGAESVRAKASLERSAEGFVGAIVCALGSSVGGAARD